MRRGVSWALAVLLFAAAGSMAAHAEGRPWPVGATDGTLESRVAPPPGFVRTEATGFGAWLRALPVRPGRSTVHLHDGSEKPNQAAHALVFAVDVGIRDLQQCADAVMRLRAEWLRAAGRADEICFRFTSGDAASWKRWRKGWRPLVNKGRVSWAKRREPSGSYPTFRSYLATVFMYAGTASLEKELERVPDPSRPEIGDLYLHGGFPGHGMLVVDVAQNEGGERMFLLAQSYMPAQEIHLVVNPESPESPWYRARAQGAIVTPEWTFERRALYRFPVRSCAPMFSRR